MSNYCILGYYNHGNFGDEQYKESLCKLLSLEECSFFDIDTVTKEKLSGYKIIVGGGDILNPYFLDKLEGILDKRVVGISVGCPYPNKITYKQIDKLFSTLFIRSKENYKLLHQNLISTVCHYLPDSSILTYNSKLKITISQIPRKIGVCLSRTIYHPLYYKEYTCIIQSFVQFFNKLLSERPTILYFIPFNTGKNSNENDTIIADDIIKLLDDCTGSDSKFVSLNKTDINLFNHLDYTICMRYHSVLYSIYYKIPFFPIFTTRKIKNLLGDINWNTGYQFSTNYLDIPTCLDNSILYNRFSVLSSPKLHFFYKKKLDDIYANLYKDVLNGIKVVSDTLKTLKSEDVIICRCNLCGLHSQLERYLYQREGKVKLYEASEISKEYLTKICLYHLIGHHSTNYNWGLSQKMFTKSFDYHAEWNFIIDDAQKWKRIIPSNPIGFYNLAYIDQNDYYSVHRSGWKFVFDELAKYHNKDASLLLDTYLDRTFHWDKEYIKSIGVVPYTKPWMGFIHHTFDTSFSPYNCEEMFLDEDFISSLIHCRGLFVLSKHLQSQVTQRLSDLNLDIPVYCLTHPTDNTAPFFSYKKFKMNRDQCIVHIGAWLRNIHRFYKLKINLQKRILKGKLMDNYFPKESFISDLKEVISTGGFNVIGEGVSRPPQSHGVISRPPEVTNNFYKHFLEDISSQLNSVEILSSITNKEYDHLLTQNIIYIYLVDASAINTVLECAIRQTPIVINKHPAVVEILGKKYPLYLKNDNDHVHVSFKDIKRAHLYLKKRHHKIMFKTNITTFMSQFIEYLHIV
jgi:polysaccharide pyruvyl transferase WcaK-like protein